MSLLANLFNSYEIESKHLESLKVLKENIVNETDLEKKLKIIIYYLIILNI